MIVGIIKYRDQHDKTIAFLYLGIHMIDKMVLAPVSEKSIDSVCVHKFSCHPKEQSAKTHTQASLTPTLGITALIYQSHSAFQ